MQVPSLDHRAHDQLLVAGLLDRPTDDPGRRRGEALVATCADCAALHRDLVDLRAAARALPTPPRPRDFTLSPEDARRLRRTGWRRLVAAFGSTRDAFSRPLAIGLTTIGLAGLLVTTIPGALPGGSTVSAPALSQVSGGAGVGTDSESSVGKAPTAAPGALRAPAASAAPSAPGPGAAALVAPSASPSAPGPGAAALVAPSASPVPGVGAPLAPSTEPGPSDQSFDTYLAVPSPSSAPAAVAPAPTSAERQGDAATGSSPGQGPASLDRTSVILLAGLLLAMGLGLFGLRWVGRRA